MDIGVNPNPSKVKPKKSKLKIQELLPTEIGCDFCSLKSTWKMNLTPRIPLSGNTKTADILVLGEAPGKFEDAEGESFVGNSGKELRSHLPSRFKDRLAFQNVVRCRPEENRTPTPAEVHCCATYLDEDVENLTIKAVLGAGNVPLHKFFPEAQILRIHGTRFPVKLGNRVVWYYPVFHPSFVLRTDKDYGGSKIRPCFENDLERFFAEVDQWEEPKIFDLSPDKVIIPRTREDAEALIARMVGPIAVDVETTDSRANKEIPRAYAYGARLLTAAFSDGQTTISFAIDHPEWQNPWGLSLLLDTIKSRRWIAHNCNYELTWFRQADPAGNYTNFDDTMALARLYHQRETLLSLELLSKIHLGVNVKKVVKVNAAKINQYSLDEVLRYNGLDAMATAPIYHKLHDKVDQEAYRRFLGAIDATTGMELLGLPVCLQTAATFKVEWEGIAARQEEDIQQLVEVEAYNRDTGTKFSISSPRQLAKVLDTYSGVDLPLTAKGNLSTNKAVLSQLSETNTLAKAILEYREAVKLVSTYIDAILSVPNVYPDGMLHPGYTVLHTATARLSSTGPNIQNFPRRHNGEIRNMIQVPDGFLLMPFDYAQLEARVLAMASEDKELCAGIINKRDIHGDWRDRLVEIYPNYIDVVIEKERVKSNVSDEKLLKILRDRVKNQFVFASFYGSSVHSCAEAMGLPLKVLEQLAGEFWTEFSGVKRWLQARRREYKRTGQMTTLTQRIRYQILHKSNEAVNTPIQGTAADIVAEAMIELVQLSRKMKDPYLHPRIQVHDDLTFILPDDQDLDSRIDTICQVMTKVRFPWQTVPLAVEAKVGTKWGEVEEFALMTGDYVK